MALNKVEICGVNTAKLPVLTSEEKEELFHRIIILHVNKSFIYMLKNKKIKLT